VKYSREKNVPAVKREMCPVTNVSVEVQVLTQSEIHLTIGPGS
jgi:hypothetical protein